MAESLPVPGYVLDLILGDLLLALNRVDTSGAQTMLPSRIAIGTSDLLVYRVRSESSTSPITVVSAQ